MLKRLNDHLKTSLKKDSNTHAHPTTQSYKVILINDTLGSLEQM